MAEFTHPLRIADIPAKGQHLRIDASPAQCEAVAGRLELAALHQLSAELDLVPLDEGGLAVTGRFEARAEQRCVVTLEPVESEIAGDIDLRFLPPDAFRQHEASLGDPADEPEQGPDVELLTSESLDLAELLLQELSLALNPYPRIPGHCP